MWENFVWVNFKEPDDEDHDDGWHRKKGEWKKTAEECLRTWFLRVFQPARKLYRFAFNSFVWTSRSESVRLAFGRRLREIAGTFASLYLFLMYDLSFACALSWQRIVPHSKAVKHPITDSVDMQYLQIKLNSAEFVAFESFRSVHPKVNIILILQEFQFYWFFSGASFSMPAQCVCAQSVAVGAEETNERHPNVRTFICSLQVKWHSIELFRLIKTFARTAHQMALGWSARVASMRVCSGSYFMGAMSLVRFKLRISIAATGKNNNNREI